MKNSRRKATTPIPRIASLGIVLLLGAGTGCTSLLGDFTTGGGGGGPDAAREAQGSSGGSVDSGGTDVSQPPEAGEDAPVATADAEAGMPPPPPPPPGKPGLDLVSGGNVSKSTHYRLVGSVGEAPGGNVVGHSINYTLKGGVVAETQ